MDKRKYLYSQESDSLKNKYLSTLKNKNGKPGK